MYIYALYYAMFKAIQDKDYGLLASLWQACLTTTINCRVGLTPCEQAIFTMAQSESAKAGMELQSDSFLAFAAKALLVLHQSTETNKLRVLTTAAVRFNGAAPSRAMITGILLRTN